MAMVVSLRLMSLRWVCSGGGGDGRSRSGWDDDIDCRLEVKHA